jgi:nitroreductase
MIDRATIEHILDIAVQAPSGDNSQPWQFKIEDDSILLLNVPGKDATLYNFEERGSFLAHGALIENICIVAPKLGFNVTVELLPPIENCTARLSLSSTPPVEDILAANISKRCTNRKPYNPKRPFEETDKNALDASIVSAPEVSLYYAAKDRVNELSQIVGLNEQLLFENQPLHDFLFGMIRWSREEERISPGLYVKTMEFPLPLEILMRFVFSNFSVVEQLNKIGLSKFVRQQSTQVYEATSAFFALSIKNTTSADYMKAGRMVQRFWLTAEMRGVNVQPVTGIPYLAERIRAGAGEAFSKEEQDLILDADKRISDVFKVKSGEKIAMLFRVGYGSNPETRSMKFAPKILA